VSPPLLAVLAALAAATALAPAPWSSPRTAGHRRGRPTDRTVGRSRPVAAALVAGIAVAVVAGGIAGLVLGAGTAGAVVVVLSRFEPGAGRRRREALERQAPLVVDLVAACLASGAPLERSLEVAAAAVGTPASAVLDRATTALRLGADPGVVWAAVAEDEALAGLARTVARSQQTGAPLSSLLPRVAEQARAAQRARAEARIRTAAVRLTAPLGAAFLPAFVLLGVVPVVASWAGSLF
jgi:Flp pilus assembly protein TadB